MKTKPKWHSILIRGLVLLLVSSCVVAGGCGYKTEVEEPELGPLESPFSAIIPSAEDLFIDLFFSPYHCYEETIYYPDGSIGYSRTFANEASSYTPLSDASKPESSSVLLSMLIYEYQNEEEATKRINEEKDSSLYKKSGDTEYYANLFGFSPEEIAGYVSFWKEPAVEEVQGEEVIFFRVGRYVGNYRITMDDPPELEDGYFMPPELHDLLEFAVNKTIPKLRSIELT
jgi:hypothetical protein